MQEKIIVNGSSKMIPPGPISHSAICDLAFGPTKKREESMQDDSKIDVSFINGSGKTGNGNVKPGTSITPTREQDFTVAKATGKPAADKDSKQDEDKDADKGKNAGKDSK